MSVYEDVLYEAKDGVAVRVIVLTGAGRGFCAGADMGLLQKITPGAASVSQAQVWQAMRQDFSAALALADAEMQKSFASSDFREGIAHYVEKRAPAFTGS